MHTDLDDIAQDGGDACAYGGEFSGCPYPRDTPEFDAWRAGWTESNYSIWRGVLMDKRKKVSAE